LSLLPRIVFALLVASTFGAFFVAQRLKHDPSPVQQYTAYPVFSPNGDGRVDAERINFKLRRADEVTIDVIDRKGDVVRNLVKDRSLAAYRQTRFRWDGRTDEDRLAPDGLYRMRITLREEGRSLVIPGSFALDTTPPKILVTSIGPKPAGLRPVPKILPSVDGVSARVRFRGPGRRTTVTVFQTGPSSVRSVVGPVKLPDGVKTWSWDGRLADGSEARQGTYAVVVTARDAAGNIGTSVPLDPRTGLPAAAYGTPFPGRGGITVRKLGVLPPNVPTVGGALGQIAIDSRTNEYTWTLRRLSGSRKPARRGVRSKPFLNLHAPRGVSRLFVLDVRAIGVQQRVPYPVQSQTVRAGDDASTPRGVLVVLPAITWQGRNAIDDDGDGLPDVLDRGLPVRLDRVYARNGLPVGFARNEEPLMAYLDSKRHRYDLTTDVALAGRGGPDLRRYRGVLIAGDARWLPAGVSKALRAFAQTGGTVVSLGTDSLRREVRLTPRRRLVDPTPAAPTDLFGARLGAPVTGNTAPVENILDKIDLFKGGTGSFEGYEAYEPTRDVGEGGRPVAAAVDKDGRRVIVAATFGKGLVVRTGLVDFASHLGEDRNADALMESLWLQLSR
jgi:flagellar hook assembly protein FlgD